MPPIVPKHLSTHYNTLAVLHQQTAHNEGATRAAFQRPIELIIAQVTHIFLETNKIVNVLPLLNPSTAPPSES